MASAVDLADIKEQLNIHGEEDDAILERYLLAAKSKVVAHVRRDLDTQFSAGWPAHADQAVRMLVAHWFLMRETAASGAISNEVRFGFTELLCDLRNLS